MADNLFDPGARARSKQASRDKDDQDLAEGRVSAQDLQRRNGFIPGEVARNARITQWKDFD